MTNENDDLATRVAKKKEEIEHYKGVLERYLASPSITHRWYNTGVVHLEELQAELADLERLTDNS